MLYWGEMRLAIVGRMAPSRGSRNSPTMHIESLLSANLGSAALCFCSLRVLQRGNFILPFRTFNTHSLIQFTSSLLRLVIRAFHKLGSVS